MHQLFHNRGDLLKAVVRMMQTEVSKDFAKFVGDYHYQDSDVWTTDDIENYTEAIMKADKDFNSITLSVSPSDNPT